MEAAEIQIAGIPGAFPVGMPGVDDALGQRTEEQFRRFLVPDERNVFGRDQQSKPGVLAGTDPDDRSVDLTAGVGIGVRVDIEILALVRNQIGVVVAV